MNEKVLQAGASGALDMEVLKLLREQDLDVRDVFLPLYVFCILDIKNHLVL